MSLLLQIREKIRNNPDNWLRNTIKKAFSEPKYRGFQHLVYQIFYRNNLKTLAILYGTDKWGSHWYIEHYERHFAPLRKKQLNILEIGVGGDEKPEEGGNSLRMWRTYFSNSQIYGIDIYDKCFHDENRIKTFKGSQVDETFLIEVVKTIGRIDIIIDDGSHQNDHVIATFNFLFPKLSENGWYVIEDTQTSYWPAYGGTSVDFNSVSTIMGFLKSLTDGLNYPDFKLKSYQPNYWEKHIIAMNFYRNIIFIQKGFNPQK